MHDLEDGEEVVAITPSGASLALEVARSRGKRARGMMGRRDVPDRTGMLFVFERPGRHAFWMFGCETALDIVWLDRKGRVVHLEQSLPPCEEHPCASYGSERAASLVVEVRGGHARELGLEVGSRLAFMPPAGKGSVR